MAVEVTPKTSLRPHICLGVTSKWTTHLGAEGGNQWSPCFWFLEHQSSGSLGAVQVAGWGSQLGARRLLLHEHL